MSKTARRLLYLSFFLVFFILAPLFIAYSLGYRYRLDTNMIEKNGAFYIKSYPRDANIYLNGEKTNHQTPDQITEVRPGNYLVRLEKESYASWQKELKISAGETTFAEDIVLFLTELKKTSLGGGGSQWLINKEKNKYAYLDDTSGELFITDTEQNKNYSVYQFDAAYKLLDWSPDNQRLLLSLGTKYFIFDINQKNLRQLTAVQPEKISWDSKDSQLLWFLTNQQIYTYSLIGPAQNALTPITFTQAVNDFGVYDDYLVLHYSQNKNNFLGHFNKNDLREIQKISTENLGNIKLLYADEQRFILTLGAMLYIKNLQKENIAIPISLADVHGDRLLLSNGHEILLYNYQADHQELIDRSTQIVSDLLWHPNGSYFLTEINGQSNITEIDGRDRRNSLNILDNALKKMYLFNEKGDQLFILTPEENFYLTIQ